MARSSKVRVPPKRAFSISSTYGWTQLPPKELASRMMRATEQIGKLHKELKFDALAFTGSSGAACAFIMSVALQIPIIYVRKEGETSHGMQVECNTGKPIHSYLIVDDFIGTGTTVKNIYNALEYQAIKCGEKPPKCVGIYLYETTSEYNKFQQLDKDGDVIVNVFKGVK